MAMYGDYTRTPDWDPMESRQARRGYGPPAANRPAPAPVQAPARQTSITRQPTNTYQPAWTATIPQPAPQEAPTPYKGETVGLNSVVGLSPEERQRIYNQARANFMGTANAAGQSVVNTLGGRGFVPGESGVADNAVGRVWSDALKGYGETIGGIATEEAKSRFGQGLELDKLRVGQNQWAQEFGAGRMDRSTDELLAYMNLMQGSQSAMYAPYWQAMMGANLGGSNG